MPVVAFNRTLDQELLALLRGLSLECLVCGEFVLHGDGELRCPECGTRLAPWAGVAVEIGDADEEPRASAG